MTNKTLVLWVLVAGLAAGSAWAAPQVRITIDLSQKTVTQTNVMSIRENVPIMMVNLGASHPTNLIVRLSNETNGTMAYAAANTFAAYVTSSVSASVTSTVTNAYGLLDLNTTEFTNYFGGMRPQAEKAFTLGVWDDAEDRLLINDRVSIQNNPYFTGAPTSTSASCLYFAAYTGAVQRAGDRMTGWLTNTAGYAGNGAGLTNLAYVGTGTYYTADSTTNYTKRTGDTMSGTLNMGGNEISLIEQLSFNSGSATIKGGTFGGGVEIDDHLNMMGEVISNASYIGNGVGITNFSPQALNSATSFVAKTGDTMSGALATPALRLGGTNTWLTDDGTNLLRNGVLIAGSGSGSGFPMTNHGSAAWWSITNIGTAHGSNAAFQTFIGGTYTGTSLTVSGGATAGTLKVIGSAVIGTMAVGASTLGSATINGALQVNGDATITGNLSVVGSTLYADIIQWNPTINLGTNYVTNTVTYTYCPTQIISLVYQTGTVTTINETRSTTTTVNNLTQLGGWVDYSNALWVAFPGLYANGSEATRTTNDLHGVWDFSDATPVGVVLTNVWHVGDSVPFDIYTNATHPYTNPLVAAALVFKPGVGLTRTWDITTNHLNETNIAVTVLGWDTNYVSITTNGGVRFPNGAFTDRSSGYAGDEVPSADWVRSLFLSGSPIYQSTNKTRLYTWEPTNYTYWGYAEVPATNSFVAVPTVSNGAYVISMISTNVFLAGTVLKFPVSVEAWLSRTDDGNSDFLAVKPEIYYIYTNNPTVILGDYDCASQVITIANVKYTWTIAHSDVTLTNDAMVFGRMRVVSRNNANTITMYTGSTYPSRIQMSTPDVTSLGVRGATGVVLTASITAATYNATTRQLTIDAAGGSGSGYTNAYAPTSLTAAGGTVTVARLGASWFRYMGDGSAITLTFDTAAWTTNDAMSCRMDLVGQTNTVAFPTNVIRNVGYFSSTNIAANTMLWKLLFDKSAREDWPCAVGEF